jgi:glycosyltransferase involved in cell wall biosynthesis
VAFFLGRLNEEMGADVVADIVPDVLNAREDAVFIIGGADGPCVPRLRDLAARFPGRVVLRVNVPADRIPAMHAACDLLLAPTRDRHACMGMSIKEAMATGRVGICSRSGGIPEAVADGETGILLPTDSDLRVTPAHLRQVVLELLGDDRRRLALGEAARHRAEGMFDNRRTVARLIEIYRGLLNWH